MSLKMKFVMVALKLICYLTVGVHSAPIAYSTSNDKLTLNVPIEDVWDGLSQGHRYPIIYSGDTIALRSAYTYGSNLNYWLYCSTSDCFWTNCQSSIITSSGWTSCSKQIMFTITAKGKRDGDPINSGDTVSFRSNYYDSSHRLYCTVSSDTKCTVKSVTSSMTGNKWLSYSYATFEIYSKNDVDGRPVQYGDVVGLKYPYSSNSAWLTYSSYFYPRSCSSSSKTSCAAENTYTGFKIFKKLS